MVERACQAIDDYIDGYLSDAESIQFEQHLQVCSDCRGIIEQQRRLDDAVRRHAETLIPPTVCARPRQPISAGWIALFAVAATLLVSVSVYFLSSQSNAPRPVTNNSTSAETDRPDQSIQLPVQPVMQPVMQPPMQPVIRSVASSSHLAVIETEQTEGITFVMMYPRFEFNLEKSDAKESE